MSTEPKNSWVVNTTAATFEEDVLGRSVEMPVVVDFWAPWCGPCRALGPILEQIAADYGGRFMLVKANTDELPEAAGQFNVQGIPAVYAVVNREVVDFFSGAIPEAMVKQWLDRVLESASFKEARQLEEISPAAAEAKFRAIVSTDPKNYDAKIGLARTLIAQEQFEEAAAVVQELEERGYLEPDAQRLKAALDLHGRQGADIDGLRSAAEADPKDLNKKLALAQALAGSQNHEEALQMLLEIVKQDRKGVGEEARKFMIEIFQALPDDSELTSRFRRQLSLALY